MSGAEDDDLLIPVSWLVEDLLPVPWVAPEGDILSHVAVDPTESEQYWTPDGLWAEHRLVLLQEVEFDLPLVPGMTVRLGAPDDLPSFVVRVASDPLVFTVDDILVTFHFPPSLLQAPQAVTEETSAVDGYDLVVTGGVRLTADGDITFEEVTIESAPPAMVGDTGFVFSFEPEGDHPPVYVATGDLPAEIRDRVPSEFRGLWIPHARVEYRRPSTQLPTLTVRDASIGRGGVSGSFAFGTETPPTWLVEGLTDADAELDSQLATRIKEDENVRQAELEGFAAVVHLLSVTLEQSLPSGSRLRGFVFVPLVDRWTAFDIALGGPEGDFLLDVGGVGDEALVSLDNDWLEITVDSISYLTDDGVHYAIIDGAVRPKIPGFDWPTMQVEGLRVSSTGDVELPGGWLRLPETVPLDFHGFTLGITEFGLGRADDGERRWLGVSGELTLVKGLPASSSVEGLRFTWPENESPHEGNLQVSLQGIGVHLEIPKTLVLDGSVSYEPVLEAGDGHELTGHVFKGFVDVDILPLKTRVGADLLVGRLTDPLTGRDVTVFYIALDVDLPKPIPLGASGAGIHQLSALFGMHVAPQQGDRTLYEWYRDDAGPRRVEGDDPASTAYDLTTVKKWGPALDNFAFGAGLTLGTLFDDGRVLNLGVLAVVLVPGPVVMIEGKANLLRPLPEGKTVTQGAFHALAVIDGRADTFQVNIDAAYDLASVIAITGSVEAFFDFDHVRNWHVYLGQKEPESKRLQASVLSLLTAQSYLMIEHSGVQTGAKSGYDLEKRFGPAQVRYVALVSYHAGIFWKPKQLTGELELLGDILLKLFGFELGLRLRLFVEAHAPKPRYIHGVGEIQLRFPWPLPDPTITVELTWGSLTETPEPATFLKGGAMIHHLADAGWSLGDSPETAPVVPVDSRPVLSFGRPLQNRSGRVLPDGRLELLPPDAVDGWEFQYRCDRVELRAHGEETLLREFPVTNDVTGAKGFDTSVHSLLPTPDVQEPLWQLWHHTALDTASPRWQEAYPDENDPCPRVAPTCVDWRSVVEGRTYPFEFEYEGLQFVAEFDILPTVKQRHLHVDGFVVRFPEPVGWAQVVGIEGTIVAVEAISNGERVEVLNWTPPEKPKTTYQLGSLDPDEPLVTFDTLRVSPPPGTVSIDRRVVLKELCYLTSRELEAERNDATEMRSESGHSGDGAPVLVPDTLYQLDVETTTTRRRAEADPTDHTASRTFYFKTGHGPGVNDADVPFAETPLDDLTTYVDHTLPVDGDTHAYVDYDPAVGFGEAYVERMYETPLRLRVRDRNGRLVSDPDSRWVEGLMPLLPSGLLAWEQGQWYRDCEVPESETPPRVQYLVGEADAGESVLSPNRTYTGEVVTPTVDGQAVLYRFQFNTSRFRDLEHHLTSGVVPDSDDIQTVRSLPTGPHIDTSWLAAYDAARDALDSARAELVRMGITELGETERLHALATQLSAACTAADELDATNQRVFSDMDERLRTHLETHATPALATRPLPRQVEVIQVPVGDSNEYALLVESPQPVDWHRLSVTFGDEPVRLVWNADKTRAFVAGSTRTWFVPGEYQLRVRYGPAVAPERPAYLREGAPDEGVVTLVVRVGLDSS